jgi:hypothetical protein
MANIVPRRDLWERAVHDQDHHLAIVTSKPVRWLSALEGLLSANTPCVPQIRMVTRILVVLTIVLAIIPRARPILFQTLGNIARALSAVLLVIWATGSSSRRRL